MPTINKRFFCVCILSFSLVLIPPGLKAEEEIRLEGVILDAQAPQNSVAVLNGNLLRAGEKLEGYTVTEVFSDSVRLKNGVGEERLIKLSAAKPVPAAVSDTAVPEDSVSKNNSAKNPVGEMLALPGKLIGRVWEIRALRDLAIVNNACVSYYNKKKAFPADFGQLIEENFLAKSYESGLKGKYRIYLVRPPDPAQFGVHADPVDAAGLKYFYVGTDAIIRESTGKPAGPADEPHEY